MRFLIYTFELVFAVIDSTIKRVLRGAKLPTWWLTTELSRKTLRRTTDHSLGWGTEWYRNVQRITARSFRNADNVISQKTQLAGVEVEWFEAVGKRAKSVILYLHGGGYVYGSTDVSRPFLNRLVQKTGRTVLSVDYRLAPETPFPAAPEDAFAVYRHLLTKEGYRAEQVTLLGDSAGAALCLAIGLQAKQGGVPMPRALVLLSPWVNPHEEGGSLQFNDEYDIEGAPFLRHCAELYLQETAPENPLFAPLFADVTAFPPMLIQVGTAEVLLTQVSKFAKKATAQGVKVTYTEYEDMFHTFINSNPNIPQSEAAMNEIVNFLALFDELE